MDQILCPSWRKKKWKQNSQFSHTFLATKQNHNKLNHKKMKTFSIIFSLLGFIVKKKNEIFIFFQLSHTFSVTKHNHTTKNNHKTYRKNQRQWSLKSPLQFLPTGVEVRISPP